jgi:tRNA modification GTPase
VNLDDTIVAIATPLGRGGIGVVRLSGAEAVSIASSMLAPKRPLEPAHATFTELIDTSSGERLDEVVVTYFAKPHSYTTDDVVEISCHGSPVVLRQVVEMALSRGARLAAPGEFTMRAFLNGRIDLTQAEAVRDLIDSQTLYQARIAAQQLDGSVSHRLQPIKDLLVELIALLEAGIDFADDDVAILPGAEILCRVAAIDEPLARMEASFQFGKAVKEGLMLAIVGRPNVGKSSLFNRLVERERAIVTATPGTTRDLVTETVAIGGIPVHLVDTAGIRHALDEAEHIGMRKSMEALADADLVLIVLDASQPIDKVDTDLMQSVEQRAAIVVGNKSDLANMARAGTEGRFVSTASQLPIVWTSATTGDGIEKLRDEILARVRGRGAAEQESGFLTNIRQHDCVRRARNGLAGAAQAAQNEVPHEMLLIDLYESLRAIDELTGATTADDILNLIFGRFCIGK